VLQFGAEGGRQRPQEPSDLRLEREVRVEATPADGTLGLVTLAVVAATAVMVVGVVFVPLLENKMHIPKKGIISVM